MSKRTSGEHEIINDLGLHARAASKVVKLANEFDAEVWLSNGSHEVNAQSILGVLMLACAKGSKVSLRTDGKQAVPAYAAIAELIDDGFGEL